MSLGTVLPSSDATKTLSTTRNDDWYKGIEKMMIRNHREGR